jgi:hypothetical protein
MRSQNERTEAVIVLLLWVSFFIHFGCLRNEKGTTKAAPAWAGIKKLSERNERDFVAYDVRITTS